MINEETISINDLEFGDSTDNISVDDIRLDVGEGEADVSAELQKTPSDDASNFEQPINMELGGMTQSNQTPTTKPETGKDDAAAPTARELELFKKLHGGSFDPMSSMDKRKLQQLRQAAQQTGEEDVNKLASTAYALQDKDKTTARTPQKSAAKQPAINKATAPASLPGGPTYYVRTGFNQYRPAVNADVSSNQQLFMKNPNPVGRSFYPYVKVDSRSIRRASPAR
jgi:hypothetical protein